MGLCPKHYGGHCSLHSYITLHCSYLDVTFIQNDLQLIRPSDAGLKALLKVQTAALILL